MSDVESLRRLSRRRNVTNDVKHATRPPGSARPAPAHRLPDASKLFNEAAANRG